MRITSGISINKFIIRSSLVGLVSTQTLKIKSLSLSVGLSVLSIMFVESTLRNMLFDSAPLLPFKKKK